MDAVSDRDFVMELLAALAVLGVHLSRLAEDLILWASAEFGFLIMDDGFATGSSLMPQKKNPDVPELVRGYAGFAIGQLTAFLAVMKGLPLSYNRDMQWDKEYVPRAADQAYGALRVLSGFLTHARIRPERAQQLVEDDTLCATDLAEYLVTRGVPFTDAHAAVGKLVVLAERRHVQLRELSLTDFRRANPAFGVAAIALCDSRRSVARKRSAGSTNPRQVARALARWRKQLGS